jgi:hypothetical protein
MKGKRAEMLVGIFVVIGVLLFVFITLKIENFRFQIEGLRFFNPRSAIRNLQFLHSFLHILQMGPRPINSLALRASKEFFLLIKNEIRIQINCMGSISRIACRILEGTCRWILLAACGGGDTRGRRAYPGLRRPSAPVIDTEQLRALLEALTAVPGIAGTNTTAPSGNRTPASSKAAA